MSKQDFIDEIVFGWIKGDLEHMKNNIPLDKYEQGNIHFPLALCTLAYLEFLGGFLANNTHGFYTKVRTYMDKCFPNPKEYNVGVLEDLVRDNLVHNYFPFGAISRRSFRVPFYKGRTYKLVLNAETLVLDFLESLDKFKEVLTEEEYENMMREYEKVRNYLEEKHKKFIDNLSMHSEDVGKGPSPAAPEIDDNNEDTRAPAGDSGIAGQIGFTHTSNASGVRGPHGDIGHN